jgi:uncharacterized protein (TIRG00374 family)
VIGSSCHKHFYTLLSGQTSFFRKHKLPESVKSRKFRYVSLVVRAAVAVAASVWVLRGQDWGQLAGHIARLNPIYLIFALAVYMVGQVLVAVRWWLLLRALSIHTEVWTAIKLFFLGLFYSNVMPSSVGGDLLRAWYVTKHAPNKKVEAVLSIFVDRAVGLTGTFVIAVFSYLVLIREKSWSGAFSAKQSGAAAILSEHKWLIAGSTAAMGCLLGLMLLDKRGRRTLSRWRSLVREHGVRVVTRSKDAIVIYCSKPLTMIVALALTIFLQSIVIAGFWVLGRNLGITAEAKYYFVFFPVTWGLAAIPVSIAGLGLLEGGVRELFTRFAGVSVERAIALALCQRIIWILGSLPGAAVHTLGGHLPKDFSVDCDKPMN